MNWELIFETIWAVANTPAIIATAALLVIWLLNRVYAAKPGWQKREGDIIAAIKFAERTILDDNPNKSVRRLDAALQYVLKIYKQTGRAAPSAAEREELRQGIQIKHAELEANGNLDK